MFEGTGRPLSESGLKEVADKLGVGLPALWAVMTVETKGCGFLKDRRPLILFERHIFHRRTNGRFDTRAPEVSHPKAGDYGAGGANQYERLARAIRFDRKAALESASWGLGQVMGFNSTTAGYRNVEAMVQAMCESEDLQFQAMAGFIAGNKLSKYLRQGDWAGFAYRYNGTDFQRNAYDTRLASEHARYLAGPLPSLAVRAAQLYLTYLDYAPGAVDGWFGRNTQKALVRFQGDKGLSPSGNLDGATIAALEKAAMG